MKRTSSGSGAGGLVCLAGLACGVCAAGAGAQAPLVVFVHDQTDDVIIRMQDLNGDGDMHDPGEAAVFLDDSLTPDLGIDNSQGMVALSPSELIATDNFEPDNIVRAVDLDGNGDALGLGETSVFYNGVLPDGNTMKNPADLWMRADGSYLFIDNNTLNEDTNPEAIYELRDLNSDGDMNDAGEVSFVFELSPVGECCLTTSFDLVEDDQGLLYIYDIADPTGGQIESIDVIDPVAGTRSEWIDSADLFANTGFFFFAGNEMGYEPATGEIYFQVAKPGSVITIVAFKDRNGSGAIDALNEVREVWSENLNADGLSTGAARDIAVASDGSVVWTDGLNDKVYRLYDANGDGDFNDAGESIVIYDTDVAEANGLPRLVLPFSVAVTDADAGCPADLSGDGMLNIDDVLAFVDAFATMDPQADFAAPMGVFNIDDVIAYLDAFAAGCP